jgi:hypothetical protein
LSRGLRVRNGSSRYPDPKPELGSPSATLAGGAASTHPPLSRAELPVDTVLLARYLIDKLLVREMAEGVGSGRIVETEAYVVGDAAGHAYRGIMPRSRSGRSFSSAGTPISISPMAVHTC